MRNPAAQGRADANHVALSDLYRALHCSVVNTYHVGGGFPDAVIGCGGITALVEFKMPDGDKTPAQKTFHKEWRGSKVEIVRTSEDVINHVQRIRSRFSQGEKA